MRPKLLAGLRCEPLERNSNLAGEGGRVIDPALPGQTWLGQGTLPGGSWWCRGRTRLSGGR
jgi:hypothetical protein